MYRLTRQLILSLLLPWLTGSNVLAEPCPSPKSPTKKPTPGEILEGRLRLLDQAMQRTVTDLERQQLTDFSRSYETLITVYAHAADDVLQAMQESGYALTQTELALAELRGLTQPVADQKTWVERQRQEVASLTRQRGEVRQELQRLHQTYLDRGKPEELVEELALLVDRLEHFDQLLAALQNAGEPRQSAAEQEAPFVALQKHLAAEEQLVLQHVKSMTELMVKASEDMQVTAKYLELHGNLPTQQVSRLHQTRKGLRGVLTSLEAWRSQTPAAPKTRWAIHDGPPADVLQQVQKHLPPENTAKTGE